jgi:hypothetical protein
MEETPPVVPNLPPPTPEAYIEAAEKPSKAPIVLIVVAVVVVLALIAGAVLLLRSSTDTTARVRDLFIIFMALESFVLGAALIILIIQLATLINLLQNEIKPIIHSTSETVNTLKGTVVFLSDNLSEPVIKLNAYLAGIKSFMDVISPRKKKR